MKETDVQNINYYMVQKRYGDILWQKNNKKISFSSLLTEGVLKWSGIS